MVLYEREKLCDSNQATLHIPSEKPFCDIGFLFIDDRFLIIITIITKAHTREEQGVGMIPHLMLVLLSLLSTWANVSKRLLELKTRNPRVGLGARFQGMAMENSTTKLTRRSSCII
jgi:hypothetical protein